MDLIFVKTLKTLIFGTFFGPSEPTTFKMSKIRLRQVSYFMTTFTQKIRKK